MNPEVKKTDYWTFRNLRTKLWFWFVVAVGTFLIYNLDAIQGKIKFERLCRESSGARFYGKVERNQGWMVESHDKWAYQSPFAFNDVPFVRYENAKGERFDVTRKKGKWMENDEYTFGPVDESRSVRYKFVPSQFVMPDDARFSQTRYEVIDLATEALLASYTKFSFRWTKPERVILNAPTGESCPRDGSESDKFTTQIYNFGSKQ